MSSLTDATILYRQVHPHFIEDGIATSAAFRPSPKDKSMLSTYDGDMISAEFSHLHFTTTPVTTDDGTPCLPESDGVLAVSVLECRGTELRVIEDRAPFDEHISVDFSDFGTSAMKRKAKALRNIAMERGWQYRP